MGEETSGCDILPPSFLIISKLYTRPYVPHLNVFLETLMIKWTSWQKAGVAREDILIVNGLVS